MRLPLGGGRGRSVFQLKRGAMCEKCVEINKTIERYRRIILSIGDHVTTERTKELIADLQAQKEALHPEREK
jgi:hypothetical protein